MSAKGIYVDWAKIDVIKKLHPLILVKGVLSFLGNVGFYQSFIKYFPMIANQLSWLMDKETNFLFNKNILKVFVCLKRELVVAPIIIDLD